MGETIDGRRNGNGKRGEGRLRVLEFTKWTSFGNTFVLLDETKGPSLSEAEKSRFAFQATNACFGVGSDNLLVVQKCTPDVLRSINRARCYWQETPDASQADLVFRMFEPDGEEAFSCGNGLMSIAAYLRQSHGVSASRVLTEVPFASPRPVSIGYNPVEGWSWASLGVPRRVPDEIVSATVRAPYSDQMDRLQGVTVPFRQHDLSPYDESVALGIWGYLVFTGEPHLVVFPAEVFPSKELVESVLPGAGSRVRREFGTRLVHRIGWAINNELPDLVPRGLNVNFVRVASDGRAIEYRCFERGINRETLACGTGALAVAYVCRALGLCQGESFELWPHGCRQYDPTATLRVHPEGDSWVLSGQPKVLFSGLYPWDMSTALRLQTGKGPRQRKQAGLLGGGDAGARRGTRNCE